jgi:hypothetical protein
MTDSQRKVYERTVKRLRDAQLVKQQKLEEYEK